MAWYKVDDQLHTHPKARRAGLAAMGLWTLAGSHSMCYLTDGFVEAWFVESLPDGPALAARLVDAGMWDEAEGGWQFHDWAEYQPTRESVQADREAAAERKRRWKAKRDAEREAERAGEAERNASTNAGGTRSARDPERVGNNAPTPTPTPSPQSSKGGAAKRGTRIPDEFIVTADMRAWASTHAPLVNVDRSTTKFVNFWRAKTGKDATKLDWLRTWQNWLLSDQEKAENSGRRLTPSQRAAQTAAAGRNVAGRQITTLEIEG